MRGFRSKYTPFSGRTQNRRTRALKVAFTLFYLLTVPVYIYYAFQPAEASAEVIAEQTVASLAIPAISLDTPVIPSVPENQSLSVPDRVPGVYSEDPSKLLLLGHSSTIFKDLKNLAQGDEIIYNSETYIIKNIEILEKSAISMPDILAATSQKTIILMTCAGQPLGHNDYTHRLIITATN